MKIYVIIKIYMCLANSSTSCLMLLYVKLKMAMDFLLRDESNTLSVIKLQMHSDNGNSYFVSNLTL